MKNVFLMLALVGLLAAPALAGVVTASPASAVQIAPAGPRGAPIYADLGTSGYYLNAGTTSTYPLPVGDDIHAISGGTITSLAIGYYTTDTGPFNLHVAFFANDATDSTPPPYPLSLGSAIASLVLNDMPGGGAWALTFTGLSIPVGQDFWFEEDWSNSYAVVGATAVANGGPLLTMGTPTVGTSHDLFSQTGSTWYLTGAYSNFYLEFDTPEPATIGLLALAGLMILRRR